MTAVNYMFDGSLLENLDMKSYDDIFKNPDFDYFKPSDGLILRPLSSEDYNKQYIHLLSQLTSVGTVSHHDFIKRFNAMKQDGSYYLLVIEDTKANDGKGKIVACGTVCIEQKFIHSCALRGRLEEIVVDKDYQKMGLRKVILGSVTALSKKLGCYKTTLESADEDIPLYEQFNYLVDKEKFLQQRFRE